MYISFLNVKHLQFSLTEGKQEIRNKRKRETKKDKNELKSEPSKNITLDPGKQVIYTSYRSSGESVKLVLHPVEVSRQTSAFDACSSKIQAALIKIAEVSWC